MSWRASRFRRPLRDVLLVRNRDVSRPVSAEQARAFLAKATHNGEPLPDEELERIAAGLESGELRVVRVRERLPPLEQPPVRNLSDLSSPEPVERLPSTPWVSIEVVDENGTRYPNLGVQFLVENGDEQRVGLGSDSSARIDLPPDQACEFLLTDYLDA